jgi:hypothetical protein
MIFSENRFPLFGIMLSCAQALAITDRRKIPPDLGTGRVKKANWS